jgi:hypothetical protein
MRTRADRLVAQPGGFRAFIPNPLPPEPPIQRDDETDTLLSAHDTNLGRLDGDRRSLGTMDHVSRPRLV